MCVQGSSARGLRETPAGNELPTFLGRWRNLEASKQLGSGDELWKGK